MAEAKSSQADMTTSTPTGYKQSSSYQHIGVPAENQYQEQSAHAVIGLTGFHEQQQPFLTPSARTGGEHVALRMAESRNIPRRQDRMMAYSMSDAFIQTITHFQYEIANAYHDCIMARTNIIPWLTKQYSKGPPDAMFGKSKQVFSCLKDIIF